jgi:adenylate kinase family enzyme
MQKVAIFGKPGSGKSRLGKQLAAVTGLPLYPLDSIVYDQSGAPRAPELYVQDHDAILASERWIMDGFAPFTAINSFFQRLEAADTLIYIDLPYPASYWFVSKRLIKGLWRTPDGWPEGSSVIQGSIASYKTLKLCPEILECGLAGQVAGHY